MEGPKQKASGSDAPAAAAAAATVTTAPDQTVKREVSTKTHQKQRGLPRPKTPLHFQISSLQAPSTSGPASPPTSTATTTLQQRLHLLTLIHRRNKNQHHSQPFFKHLNILRRSLRRLLAIQTELDKLSHETIRNPNRVRWRFEREATLRSQRDVVGEYLREIVVPACYGGFGGLVGDGQFANLGVVLFGCLGEVVMGREGVGGPKGEEGEVEGGRYELVGGRAVGGRAVESRGEEAGRARSLVGRSTRVTGEDQGEVIERVYESGDGGGDEVGVPMPREEEGGLAMSTGAQEEQQPVEKESEISTSVKASRSIHASEIPAKKRRRDESETKSKKKKKRKDAIDDLFSGLI
ncbi:RNase MRP subunit [Knufia obscura]|uniref:RNase MRP subunit n=1 Tax=Knufia obscura TaxID=1635080 RepID=A0ABR0RNH4_9EURO|nr:RNase MRP subunit [Knufia obscura]